MYSCTIGLVNLCLLSKGDQISTLDNRFLTISSPQSTPGLEQYAIKKFAEALEVVPRTISENAGVKVM